VDSCGYSAVWRTSYTEIGCCRHLEGFKKAYLVFQSHNAFLKD